MDSELQLLVNTNPHEDPGYTSKWPNHDIDIKKAVSAITYCDTILEVLQKAKASCENSLANCGDNAILTNEGNPCAYRLQTSI